MSEKKNNVINMFTGKPVENAASLPEGSSAQEEENDM